LCGFARAAAFVFPDPRAGARPTAALVSARNLVDALDEYRRTHRQMPGREEGLAVLNPHLSRTVSADPWGNPFVYQTSPDRQWADVLSYGADGKPGGRGEAADISGRFGPLGSPPPAALDSAATAVFFLLPLIGLLRARRRDWAAGLLAGLCLLCAVVLSSLLSATRDAASLGLLPATGVTLACLAAGAALARRAPGARFLAFAAVAAAFLALDALITI